MTPYSTNILALYSSYNKKTKITNYFRNWTINFRYNKNTNGIYSGPPLINIDINYPHFCTFNSMNAQASIKSTIILSLAISSKET